ncbi:MAG: hypothetical protein ACRD6X_00765 [Pyrinomonadaceae bacterium]
MIYFKRYFRPIENIVVIARRFSIRDLQRLRRDYGGKDWRKLKGVARVELFDGTVRNAEIHWYECHGIGKRELKIKRMLD